MNPDKKIIVGELLDRVNASTYVMVIDYVGMTVPEFTELRDRLHEVDSECHVAKNNMMRRALVDAELPDIAEHLTGQTAFLTGESDFAAAAKVVKNFQKEFKRPEIRVAILESDVLDSDQVKAIADLPSREVLLGMLLGTINAPATKLLRTVKEPGASLARVIQAKFNPEG